MATQKLSQITASVSNFSSTDYIVGVQGGTSDVLFSYSQVIGREVLRAARDYYVRTDGSDSNSGLANTSTGAFLTIQAGINAARALDFRGSQVRINLGSSGTYSGVSAINAPMVGITTAQQFRILGSSAAPTNFIVTSTGNTLTISDGADVDLRGVSIGTTAGSGSNAAIFVTRSAQLWYQSIDFGHSSGAIQLWVTDRGFANASNNYSISGNGASHVQADTGGQGLVGFGLTVTLNSTPTYTGAFATSIIGGIVETSGNTYSGTASGTRYAVNSNAIISVSGASSTYFPGTVSGTSANGGFYG